MVSDTNFFVLWLITHLLYISNWQLVLLSQLWKKTKRLFYVPVANNEAHRYRFDKYDQGLNVVWNANWGKVYDRIWKCFQIDRERFYNLSKNIQVS